MMVLNNGYMNLHKLLFNNYQPIENRNNIEKNISEELLTFRTLVLISPPVNKTDENQQLGKILSACKLQNNDYMISSLTKDWSFYRNSDSIKEVILFGVDENDLNISIQLKENQLVKFDNRIWIKTVSIHEMMKNQAIKNTLWQQALKPHFVG